MMNQASCKKVFYEVVGRSAAASYAFKSGTLGGLSPSYEGMIQRIRAKPRFQNVPLELIQVESLEAVNPNQDGGVYPNVAMRSSQMRGLFGTHQLCGIPLHHSVAVVCRAKGISLGDLTKSAGYNRNYLNLTLRGLRSPPSALKEVVIEALGIDPWLYSPHTEPVVIKREVIAAS